MFNNIPLLLGAPATGGAASGSSSSYIQILMIVGVFAVFYLLIIRPQRKKQKDTKNMLAAIKKGDKVTSIGGIRGTVKNSIQRGRFKRFVRAEIISPIRR